MALVVTDRELSAIAPAAIMGLSVMSKKGYNRPAAMGMPIMLKAKAKTRFSLMFRMVDRLNVMAVTTPRSSPEISVMSEDSIATSVPVPMAIPTSA